MPPREGGVPPLASPLWSAVLPVAASAEWPLTTGEWVQHARAFGCAWARDGLAWLEARAVVRHEAGRWFLRRTVLDSLLDRAGLSRQP